MKQKWDFRLSPDTWLKVFLILGFMGLVCIAAIFSLPEVFIVLSMLLLGLGLSCEGYNLFWGVQSAFRKTPSGIPLVSIFFNTIGLFFYCNGIGYDIGLYRAFIVSVTVHAVTTYIIPMIMWLCFGRRDPGDPPEKPE